MTGLRELLSDRCPDGVAFSTLGELGSLFSGLTGKSKAHFSSGNARYVTYTNVFSNPVTDVTPDDRVVVAPGERQNVLRRGDVLFTMSSESAAEVGMSSVVMTEPPEPLHLNSFCFGWRPHETTVLDPAFAGHLFRSSPVRRQIVATGNGVTRINISRKPFLAVRIPVPPLEVQCEIAQRLDEASRLHNELVAELTRELSARRSQHTYYRRLVLEEIAGHPQVALHEVADFFNAKAHEKLVDPEGTVALLTARFISTEGKQARFVRSEDVLTPAQTDDVALVMSDLPNGRALARTFLVDANDRYAANQRVCLLRVRDKATLSPRFLYHVLNRNPDLLAYDNGLDQTHLKKGYIQNVRLSLPSLPEQLRFVELLGTLDATFGELVEVLPAEVALRRTQHEYYRNRLLTFPELETGGVAA